MVFKIIGWMQSSVKPLKKGSQLNSNEIQGMFRLGAVLPSDCWKFCYNFMRLLLQFKKEILIKKCSIFRLPFGR